MIQLRIKTEYSFGQTYAPIQRCIERLKETHTTHAGIVDNSTWGHVAWYKACKAADIVPLLGAECIVSDDDKTLRMWFLAKNKAGLSELYNYMSQAHHQKIQAKFGKHPRLYTWDVQGMSENIVKFAGENLNAQFLASIDAVIDLNPASRILNSQKKKIAGAHNLRLVSTSDNAYAFEADRKTFEIASKAGLKMTEQHIVDHLDHQSSAHSLVSDFTTELPFAPMVRAEGDLEQLCRDGINARKMSWSNAYEDRLQYELNMIRSKDFESYFLIVADMVQYAKKHMLVGPSRGSAAGSLVCYLSRITEIDPIPPGLYFERFIDITRKDLPDIDLDFPDSKRHLVFEYMSEKYGTNNVAHIGTITNYKPKSALIQACKALNIPPQATAPVKVAMFERSIADARANHCLEDTLNDTEPGREFLKLYPQAKIAADLEGHASHTGVHAAGLLVCNDEIINYATVDEKGIAHIEKFAAESLGLLKIDVLGLRTLGILEDSGIPIDWYNIDLEDSKMLEVFNSEKFCGIFQFEGDAMRQISHEVKFNSIVEVDAVTALARPGPFIGGVTEKYIMRRNGQKYDSIHPLVEKIMAQTYGLPVYQEQTLAIVRDIGGFNWEETSFVRKAISKSLGIEFFQQYWPQFQKGAEERGINAEQAEVVWKMINAMGSWQMNKAHTYSYAVISIWCAYLKAHHPLEFAAANLRHAKDEDSAIQLLKEISNEGIEYLPFDLELSEINWSVKNGRLVGGFTALKGIGESKAKKLVEARNAGKLTAKDLEKINNAENVFEDIFPFRNNYQFIYDNPESANIAGKVYHIEQIENVPHKHERVFMGELISKSARDINEGILIKKRGGKVEGAPYAFLDMRVRDDTGIMGCRINRFDFEKIGRALLEKTPIGSKLLIRAKFFNNIRYAFITKWRRLDE